MLRDSADYEVCECTRMLQNKCHLQFGDCDAANKENRDDADVSMYEEVVAPSGPSAERHHCSRRLAPLLDEEDGDGLSPLVENQELMVSLLEEQEVRPLREEDSGYHTRSGFAKSSAASIPLSSFGSTAAEDDFFDNQDMEWAEGGKTLPDDFSKLIDGSLAAVTRGKAADTPPKELAVRPLLWRSASSDEATTPSSSRVRSPVKDAGGTRNAKREPPPDEHNPKVKRYRASSFSECRFPDGPATPSNIEHALACSAMNPNLIGDFSKNFYLPIIAGRHSDLKSISPDTLVTLLMGGFDSAVATFKIIDCRYPYEYEGGHINGALNIFTRDQCAEFLESGALAPRSKDCRRHILVFHCEFSSERGPSLSRFLRNLDRKANEYPALTYPEIYILDGGYKKFFQYYSQLCTPMAYKPMNHPNHKQELRLFRSRAKTWTSNGGRQRQLF